MTDRPHTFTVRSSTTARLAAALVAEPAVGGVSLDDGLLTVRASDFGAFSRLVAGVARRGGIRLFEMLPTDESLESVFSLPGALVTGARMNGVIAMITMRQLLSRRRTLLLGLLGVVLAGGGDRLSA